MSQSERPPEPHPDAVTDTELVWPPRVADEEIVWIGPATTGTQPPLLARQPLRAVAGGSPSEHARVRQPDSVNQLPIPPVQSAASALSLSCLLFLEVPLDWHDAVAIVQQLAHQVTDGLALEPSGSLPDIGDIGIEPNGHLLVHLDPHGRQSVVRGCGYLLHQLLQNREDPVGLRLLVAQIVSDLPTITSVVELSRELARWERPRRIEKLVQVYDRAQPFIERRPAPPAAESPGPAEDTPIPVPEPSEPIAVPTWTEPLRALLRPHQALIAGIAVGLIVLLTTVVSLRLLISFAPEPAPVPRPMTVPTVLELQSLQAPDSLEIVAVSSRPSSVPPIQPTSPVLATEPITPRVVTEATLSHAEPEAPRRAVAPAGLVDTQNPVPAPTQSAHQPAATVRQPSPATLSTPGAEDPNRIYQQGDAGFIEAVLIKPSLPDRPDPSRQIEQVGTLELVVNADGTVDLVRLNSPFNRYRERWWVYAAKNWQFRPAVKDGKPVKSLKRIVIANPRSSEPQ
jgi:hypothetical protein